MESCRISQGLPTAKVLDVGEGRIRSGVTRSVVPTWGVGGQSIYKRNASGHFPFKKKIKKLRRHIPVFKQYCHSLVFLRIQHHLSVRGQPCRIGRALAAQHEEHRPPLRPVRVVHEVTLLPRGRVVGIEVVEQLRVPERRGEEGILGYRWRPQGGGCRGCAEGCNSDEEQASSHNIKICCVCWERGHHAHFCPAPQQLVAMNTLWLPPRARTFTSITRVIFF